MGSNLKWTLAAAIVLLMSCMTIRSWLDLAEPPIPPLPPKPDGALPQVARDAGLAAPPVWLEGPLLRAASIAVDDLASRANLHSSEPYMEALFRCMARPDAYDVQVIQDAADRWFVFVRPREWRCFDGGGMRPAGGGATYEISKEDFRILSAQFWE